jgi:hypothetical protein
MQLGWADPTFVQKSEEKYTWKTENVMDVREIIFEDRMWYRIVSGFSPVWMVDIGLWYLPWYLCLFNGTLNVSHPVEPHDTVKNKLERMWKEAAVA